MNYNGYTDPALSSSAYYPQARRPYPAGSYDPYDPYYTERDAAYDRYAERERPSSRVWSQKIPIEKKYVEYVPQQKVDYVPVEREYTDFLEIEHQTDYVPIPKLNKRIEYIPVERFDQSVEYQPVQKSQVKGYSKDSYASGYDTYAPQNYYPGSYKGYSERGYEFPISRQYPYPSAPYSYGYGLRNNNDGYLNNNPYLDPNVNRKNPYENAQMYSSPTGLGRDPIRR